MYILYGGVSTLQTVMFAVSLVSAFVFGLWSWFLARRFLAREIARWQALIPTVLWMSGALLILTILSYFDATLDDGYIGPLDLDEPPTPQEIENRERTANAAMRDEQIREYGGLVGMALMASAVVASAWCTVRGMGRDPIPIEDHFA